MEELEKQKAKHDFDSITATLKELYKQLKLFTYLTDRKYDMTVFTLDNAIEFIDKLSDLFKFIVEDK